LLKKLEKVSLKFSIEIKKN